MLFMWKCCWSWTVITANSTSQRSRAEQMVWNRTGSLLAFQNSWQHVFLFLTYTTTFRISSLSFLGVFIGLTQLKWFWLVYPKGELSSLAVDKGISPRKGEEEEEEEEGKVLCSAGRMRRCCLNAHTHTRPLFSLVSLAQCDTYIAHTFTAHFVISVSEQGRACSRDNARGVIQMTRRQIDLKWQDSCCTSQRGSFLVSCVDLIYMLMTHWYSAWVSKPLWLFAAHLQESSVF